MSEVSIDKPKRVGQIVKATGNGRSVYIRKKKVPGEGGWWPENKKIEAVTAYLSTGSPLIASAMTKVPTRTIEHWKKSVWWKEMVAKIQDEDNQELDAKYTKIIKKTLAVIDDRIDNGNFQFDPKTGRVVRIPVNLRDTHRVMSDLVNQRGLIRKEPQKVEENAGTVNDRLLTLAEQFAKFALGKQPEPDMKIVQGSEVYENDNSIVENGGEPEDPNVRKF